MDKFKIGDRVFCAEDYSGTKFTGGLYGYVRDISFKNSLLIEFESPMNGHEGRASSFTDKIFPDIQRNCFWFTAEEARYYLDKAEYRVEII